MINKSPDELSRDYYQFVSEFTQTEFEDEKILGKFYTDIDITQNMIQLLTAKGEIPPYVEEVCNTFANAWQPISNEMRDLYRTVRGHEDDIQLSTSVKSTIDQFMADDDELPF